MKILRTDDEGNVHMPQWLWRVVVAVTIVMVIAICVTLAGLLLLPNGNDLFHQYVDMQMKDRVVTRWDRIDTDLFVTKEFSERLHKKNTYFVLIAWQAEDGSIHLGQVLFDRGDENGFIMLYNGFRAKFSGKYPFSLQGDYLLMMKPLTE